MVLETFPRGVEPFANGLAIVEPAIPNDSVFSKWAGRIQREAGDPVRVLDHVYKHLTPELWYTLALSGYTIDVEHVPYDEFDGGLDMIDADLDEAVRTFVESDDFECLEVVTYMHQNRTKEYRLIGSRDNCYGKSHKYLLARWSDTLVPMARLESRAYQDELLSQSRDEIAAMSDGPTDRREQRRRRRAAIVYNTFEHHFTAVFWTMGILFTALLLCIGQPTWFGALLAGVLTTVGIFVIPQRAYRRATGRSTSVDGFPVLKLKDFPVDKPDRAGQMKLLIPMRYNFSPSLRQIIPDAERRAYEYRARVNAVREANDSQHGEIICDPKGGTPYPPSLVNQILRDKVADHDVTIVPAERRAS